MNPYLSIFQKEETRLVRKITAQTKRLEQSQKDLKQVQQAIREAQPA